MKNMPSALLTFLASKQKCYRVELFKIVLSSGQTIYACTGQIDVLYAGNLYYAAQYGTWSRGSFTSKLGTEASSMPLTVNIQPNITVPGTSVALIQAAGYGLFDAAQVTVYTVYMPTYGDVSLGAETKFFGEITAPPKIGRTQCVFTVQDPRYRLNQQLPRKLVQASCGYTLFDSDCTLVKASFTVTFTAAAGSSPLVVIMNPIGSYAANYFQQGVLNCTSGANAGLSMSVKSYDNVTGKLTLVAPFLFTVATGDGFTVTPGCDKTQNVCLNTFNNLIHFGGQTYTPVPETVL